MRAAIILAIAFALQTARADDLDVIVDSTVSAENRGQAYDRLTTAEFRAIAPKLAKLIGTHPILTGIGPRTEQPWTEAQLSPGDRIGCTLHQIWSHHLKPTERRGGPIPLMLDLLDDPEIGAGRHLAIAEISWRLHFGRAFFDPSLPALDTILSRLDRLVTDAKQPADLRHRILEILFEHGDPNKYLSLAIELSAAESTPLQQSEAFRFCTSAVKASKFTDANRKKYIRHCYQLLEQIDNRRSGTGYFLAIHIGHFVGVPPVREGQGSFAPDQRLKQYQDPHGLTESFFQDTVVNARKWWTKHKEEYQGGD